MRRFFVVFTICIVLSSMLTASDNVQQDKKMEWWREARFDMFIHWGVYTVPGGISGQGTTVERSSLDDEPNENTGKGLCSVCKGF